VVLQVTPHGDAPSPVSLAEKRLRRLLDLARPARRPLIQLQHNPDPDALASGFALRWLLQRVFQRDTTIAFTGTVGRAENRAMMRYLRIQIVPAFRVDYASHDLVAVVDTHPGSGTCRLPPGVHADLVLDHHPTESLDGDGAGDGSETTLHDPGYGATSTLIGEILLANGLAVPQRVATALAYGIQTDTLDLARHVSPTDERVFATLYALADKRLLGRIQRARVPQEYFQALERGLRRAVVHDAVVTTHLGDIEHPDLVAEVADLLFRLEGMSWGFVTGSHDGVLYASIRSVEGEHADAGDVARAVAGPEGSGGGHDTFSAAQVPMGDLDGSAAHARALARFLDAVGVRKAAARNLTVPPGASTD
jgi:nanoRNase/pAp phosphatase (c-di-AMP/oligoRNAs hydrolase)